MTLAVLALLVGSLLHVLPAHTAVVDLDPPTRAAFVTLLGVDTLAVERFSHSASGMEAHVVLRSPRTSASRYTIDFDEDGHLTRYEAVTETPAEDGTFSETRRDVLIPTPDGLQIATTTDGETQSRTIDGDASALPFIDMVHWPFEEMLRRVVAVGQDSLVQPLFTARGTMPFVVRKVGDGALTVTHPFRGTMEVNVGADGALQFLSAGATTRALTVTRVASFDTEAFAHRSAALDAAGLPFGPLSGRGDTRATVHGVNFHIDFGQPARRGRDIFGNLVEWGQIWRTGANLATHIEIDSDIRVGDFDVPAGQYTLFSIPEPDGGMLIFNRQTGQTGTAYDPAYDLGRVPMIREDLAGTVELFNIDVVEAGDGGELRIEWDRSAFVVPITFTR